MTGKRTRLSAEETRERLRDAGVAALRESGLSIGLDAVNLEQAIRDADVSRSSAYAAWASERYSPQEQFQRSVLKHAVENRKVTLDDLTSKTAEMYETLVETLPRRELFREMIRVAAHENMEATADSIGWRLVIALRASLHSAAEEERDPDLAQWMNDSAVSLREYTISTLYKPLAAAFELEPRPQYGERAYELGEVCMAAISEGFSMRYWLDSRQYLDGLEHHDIVGGEANWSMYSMLFEQAVEMFFVPKSGSWDDF